MDKKENENKRIIIIMLVITVVLAIVAILLYIPKQLGYSNLSCGELDKENALIIESANNCKINSDCIIETDVIMHQCGCYELINKNTDMEWLKLQESKISQLYTEKNCPIPECGQCEMPIESSVKCLEGKCGIENS